MQVKPAADSLTDRSQGIGEDPRPATSAGRRKGRQPLLLRQFTSVPTEGGMAALGR